MITSYKQQLINAEPNEEIKTKIENINVIVTCSTGSPFGFIHSIIKTEPVDGYENKEDKEDKDKKKKADEQAAQKYNQTINDPKATKDETIQSTLDVLNGSDSK
jgi:hypothetical protein